MNCIILQRIILGIMEYSLLFMDEFRQIMLYRFSIGNHADIIGHMFGPLIALQ